ncbi:hypothetical protein L1S35_01255 [Flavobacterium sp. AS60]|uniref:hypothetical protein n=1 Tax=Flavobacterium anseongense TaxID=2910677 RepID=UPI001F395260|nr:hypothetical protein [Flavobacterium sp. AS60]MCF6128282.1 hypothetical protein [Flavobacterium sp. AS60]
MKKCILTVALTFLFFSCGSLTSNTTIKPNDSFILGKNDHGTFKVKLKNVSKNNIEIHHEPNNGGRHSFQQVKPNELVTVKIDKNTALVFANQSKDTASVDLKVTGDIGLSMGYKN